MEESIASMYTKNAIEHLVREAVERETAKVRMEVQQQLAAAVSSSGAANQPTGQTAGFKNVKELMADPRLPHLVLW
jgi:N-acetylglutamate synthase/N-acetylornithine aminotransferase